jgi:dTMP kinase
MALMYFEGIGGCGKSTQLQRVYEWLHLEQELIATREPGATAAGVVIREMVLMRHLDKLTDLLLFMADRAEHRAAVLRPALDRGLVVLCDRGPASTLAYQHGLVGMPLVDILLLQGLIDRHHPLPPATTIWLDCPVDVAMRRAGKRGAADKFDDRAAADQQRIADSYDEQFDGDKGWYRVDADQSPDKVFAEIQSIVRQVLAG